MDFVRNEGPFRIIRLGKIAPRVGSPRPIQSLASHRLLRPVIISMLYSFPCEQVFAVLLWVIIASYIRSLFIPDLTDMPLGLSYTYNGGDHIIHQHSY